MTDEQDGGRGGEDAKEHDFLWQLHPALQRLAAKGTGGDVDRLSRKRPQKCAEEKDGELDRRDAC